MFECGTCYRGFPAGSRARDQHCQATGHNWPDYECDTCDRYFGSEQARAQHMNALGHWNQDSSSSSSDDDEPEYECHRCYDSFYTEAARKEHEIEVHHWCEDCEREFMNLNCIKQHMNSRKHRDQNITCPFCRNAYTTATGLTHHLESGSCSKAPFDGRDDVYRFVRSKDPNGLVSKNLIGWYGSDTYQVTGRTWNGSSYECYLCHRGFGSLNGLNNHINSPVRMYSPIYHSMDIHMSRYTTDIHDIPDRSAGAVPLSQPRLRPRLQDPGCHHQPSRK